MFAIAQPLGTGDVAGIVGPRAAQEGLLDAAVEKALHRCVERGGSGLSGGGQGGGGPRDIEGKPARG